MTESQTKTHSPGGSVSVTCQACKTDFIIEPDDFTFYEKISVPPPTFCPKCRMIRRIIWRNEKTMYKRKCDATGKEIFTMFHPDVPLRVYERDYWWTDAWDPKKYGRDYDFNKPFFEQFRELMLEVPWFSRSVTELENSDYSMNCSYQKDCYLTFHGTRNEGCFYSLGISDSKNVNDGLFVYKSELCYENFSISNCYKVFYSSECEESQDLYFCKDCVNCTDCVGSVGLRNKKYYIFNKAHSKEEYERKVIDLQLNTHSGVLEVGKRFTKHKLSYPVKYARASHNTDVSGDYILRAKNVKQSYVMENVEDAKYCQNIILPPGAKNCYDYSFFGNGAELIYEGSSIGINANNIKFSVFTYSGVRDIEYSIMCPSSENLFGCVAARKQQYCILNKQYSKEDYEKLVPKIKRHMEEMPYTDKKGRTYKYGEFFPVEFCPFGYNEGTSQEYFPLTKDEALNHGYSWRDQGAKKHELTISWRDLPNDIKNVEESILKEVILCQSWDEDHQKAIEHNCSKVFRIVPDELQFYRNLNLPLPRRCWNSRHYERTLLRNPPQFYDRQCMCDYKIYKNTVKHSHHPEDQCPNEFETSYAPDRKEIVYCKECYEAEVV